MFDIKQSFDQNLLVKTGPRSETIPSGGPNFNSTSVWNNSANSAEFIVVEMGKNRVYFVNRSTITRIASTYCFLKIVGGMPVMKSIVSSAKGLWGLIEIQDFHMDGDVVLLCPDRQRTT